MYLTKAMELAGLALLATRVTAVPLNETELLEIRGDGGWGWAEFYVRARLNIHQLEI